MRCNIIWTRPEDGTEILENIRDTDAIAESYGMSDSEADKMESALLNVGRYYLDNERCAYPVRESR